MLNVHPQFITNKKGKKISVVLPIDEFKTIMEELDELEDIRLYDDAKASNESSLPLNEAFAKIEAEHKSKKGNDL